MAGTSAGAIIASLIAAGASPDDLKRIATETDYPAFIQPPDKSLAKAGSLRARLLRPITSGKFRMLMSILANLGMFSSSKIEEWLEKALADLLNTDPRRSVTFSDLILPLHVVATDIRSRQPKVWNSFSTPTESVARAVRCSSTIPIFFQPVDRRFVDGGLLSNLPSFAFSPGPSSHYSRILCFTIDAHRKEDQFSLESYSQALVDTVIEGAVHIQSSLQESLHEIRIADVPLNTTDFSAIDDNKLNKAIEVGRQAAAYFFDNEIANLRPSFHSQRVLVSSTHVMNEMTLVDPYTVDHVFLSFRDCKIVYKLFPTFLAWRRHDIAVTFLTCPVKAQDDEDRRHESFRRYLLDLLGSEIRVVDELPFEGILFGSDDRRHKMAIIRNPEESAADLVGHATLYRGVDNTSALQGLAEKLLRSLDSAKCLSERVQASMQISSGNEENLIERIRTVNQYRPWDVRISFQEIELAKVVLLTRYVKAYKYNQIEQIFGMYREHESELFSCLQLSRGETCLYVTPPVVEKHGNLFIAIEGNTRLTYCYRELKLSSIRAIVVQGVSQPLPSSGRYPLSNAIVSDTDQIGAGRYENFLFENYRWIEKAVRDPRLFTQELAPFGYP